MFYLIYEMALECQEPPLIIPGSCGMDDQIFHPCMGFFELTAYGFLVLIGPLTAMLCGWFGLRNWAGWSALKRGGLKGLRQF
ncbi:MAG: hypothetical protein ACPGOY_12115 [Rhodospirillaceae bacterium]